MKKGNYRFLKNFTDYLWIIIGSFITALAINMFLVPYKIAPGGLSGISTIIYYLTNENLPVGMTMLALNIPLFIFGVKLIGRKFILRTLFSTVSLSVVIDLSKPYTDIFSKMLALEKLNSGPDYLLYAIFGGFFLGLGLGLVLKSGATTGGTDLAAGIIHHLLPGLTVGSILLIIDSAIIIFAAFVFGSITLALYAILALYISSRVMDITLEGVNFAKAIYIISDHADDIAQAIMNDLERGVTALSGVGMYTGKSKRVLYCVIQRGQIHLLKAIVKKVDPVAFVILSDVTEVLGEGFKTYEGE